MILNHYLNRPPPMSMYDESEAGRSQEEAEVLPRPLPPPDFFDPVIEVYKKDVDRTLLRENLKLTPQERCERFEQMMEMVFELQRQARSRQDQT